VGKVRKRLSGRGKGNTSFTENVRQEGGAGEVGDFFFGSWVNLTSGKKGTPQKNSGRKERGPGPGKGTPMITRS